MKGQPRHLQARSDLRGALRTLATEVHVALERAIAAEASGDFAAALQAFDHADREACAAEYLYVRDLHRDLLACRRRMERKLGIGRMQRGKPDLFRER